MSEKSIKFTLLWAKVICDGMHQERIEKLKDGLQDRIDNPSKYVDDAVEYKEDFIINDVHHEQNV